MRLALALAASLSFASLACEKKPTVPYAEARLIIARHCVMCHSDNPSVPAFRIAPGYCRLDTADDMKKWAPRIKVRTSIEKTMPLLNKTNMTDEERSVLAKWVDGGAQTN